jgi:hypothetical protein
VKTQVHVIEVRRGDELLEKEKAATAVLRRFLPDCGPVKLYRTADGKIGFEAKLALTLGDRPRLDEAYRAVTKVLGERRGRPKGPKTVQTKLRLPQPVFKALKKEARLSNATMSEIVSESLLTRFHGHPD